MEEDEMDLATEIESSETESRTGTGTGSSKTAPTAPFDNVPAAVASNMNEQDHEAATGTNTIDSLLDMWGVSELLVVFKGESQI